MALAAIRRGTAQGQQPPKPLTFADKADLAFRQGREKDGFQYLYAHALTGDDATAKEVLDKMGWVAPLKRPAMGIRWGIAIEYVPQRGYNGSIYPIGTSQNLPQKGAAGGGAPGGQPQFGGPGMEGGGMGASGQSNPLLQQLTGELGQKVVQQLQERIGRGDFGQVLASVGKAAAPGAAGGMPGAGMPGGSGEMNYGASMPGAAPGGYQGAGMPGQAQGGRPTDVTALSPGIVMLGVVSSKDLREKAQAAGVDAVCAFDIVATPNPKTQLVKNETTIHLHDLLQAKELWDSKTLNNIQIQIERADPKGGQDPVDKEIEALFKVVDTNWHLGPLPAGLKAEHVLNRLRGLIEESHENPLPVLAEIRMYQTRGLLQEEHLLKAYQKVLGGEAEGTQLAKGSEEEKKKALEKWLPRES